MKKDWKIAKGAAACGACGRPFEAGDDFYSTLSVLGEDWIRADTCAACWAGRPPEAVCFWRSRQPAPEARPAPRANLAALTDLFTELHTRADPTRAAFLYVISLMLVRKRKLKLEGETDGALHLARPTSGETFTVRIPPMNEEDLRKVQERLVALLDGGSAPEPADADGGAPEGP